MPYEVIDGWLHTPTMPGRTDRPFFRRLRPRFTRMPPAFRHLWADTPETICLGFVGRPE